MCRRDCRLTSRNQNCDIRMRFRTPICQMNENREISAESQHNFYFLPHFNSKTTKPIFTIFSHNVEQLVELLMSVSARRWCILFQNTRAKIEGRQFWRLQKSPKINWLITIATSLGLAWNLCQFCNSDTYIYRSWNVGEDRFSSCWDIPWDKPIFAITFQKYKFITSISGVTGPKFTIFVHDVDPSLSL